MPLPPEVRVKVSSEFAGAIAMAEVAVKVLPVRDLVEQMLGVTGKDTARVLDILRRGTLVAGESRLRWEKIEAGAAEVAAVFATFPDPDPGRPFHPESCFHVQLVCGRERIDMPRKVGAKRRFLRRRSFWEALMDASAQAGPTYLEYSYKLRCDHYRVAMAEPLRRQVTASAKLLPFGTLAGRIAAAAFDSLDLFVARGE